MGDRLNDIICGRRAGVDVVLVGKEAFGDVRPDFTFPSLLQLKESVL
jgi:phosphoglycolate phosphatase-like HAD superfamily hydrolase